MLWNGIVFLKPNFSFLNQQITKTNWQLMILLTVYLFYENDFLYLRSASKIMLIITLTDTKRAVYDMKSIAG